MIKSSTLRIVESAVALIGDITLGQSDRIDPSKPHGFAGIVYFNDTMGITPVTPSGGTATITIKTVVQPHGFQDANNNSLMANTITQADWSAAVTEVKATFVGIMGVTHAKMIVSQSLS